MDKIEVSQRAREAAADLWIAVDDDFVTPSILQEADRYRRGDYDQTPAVQAFARFERDILATRTDATPVAWMDLLANAYSQGAEDVHKAFIGDTASFEPDFGEAASDYARSIDFPPATDVAALVEAATAMLTPMFGDDATRRAKHLSAALAPFTKGQNDE